MAKNEEYTADDIISLDERQHLLKRMGLTFGSEGIDPEYKYSMQKTVAIREILDNATDEIRGGYGQHVNVKIFKDGLIQVQDSGRGVPPEVNHTTHQSGIYMALGKMHSGGKFATDSERFSSGLNGLGASATNFVSKRFDVIVYKNNKKYELSFKEGTPGFFDGDGPDAPFTETKDLSKLKISKDTRTKDEKKDYPTGTIIRCWLDESLFTSPFPVDDLDLVDRLKWTAFLVPNLIADVYDERQDVDGNGTPLTQTFHYPDGINSMIEFLAPNDPLIPTQHIVTDGSYIEEAPVLKKDGTVEVEKVARRIPIEIAWTYNNDYETDRVNSFVNTIHTKLGGVHVKAFERAFVKTFNDKFSSMKNYLKKDDPVPIIDDYREGLTVVLSIQQSEPGFTSQSKEQLIGSENQKAIQAALEKEFGDWISSPKNKDALEMMAKKVCQAAKNRAAANQAKAAKRKANAIESSSMPATLQECEFVGEEGSEILICEGRSAMSGLMKARDARFQAIFPIRGKIINAFKANPSKLMDNKEVEGIIKSLGAGYGKNFDVDKMRYGRVLLSTDADVDGYAIQDLLLVLFWTMFRSVIDEGRFFITMPPLFEFSFKNANREIIPALDEDARDKIQSQLEKEGLKYGKDFEIHRDKGLGENDPDVTWQTMLNPVNRTLRKITVEDAQRAMASLDLTMGTRVEPRRNWIEDNANNFDKDLMDV